MSSEDEWTHFCSSGCQADEGQVSDVEAVKLEGDSHFENDCHLSKIVNRERKRSFGSLSPFRVNGLMQTRNDQKRGYFWRAIMATIPNIFLTVFLFTLDIIGNFTTGHF